MPSLVRPAANRSDLLLVSFIRLLLQFFCLISATSVSLECRGILNGSFVAENFYQGTLQSPKNAFDLSLRPPLFSEFQGQTRVRERLELMVEAAKQRSDVLEHVLLSGPPGLGKTTLAYILANSMGVNIKTTSGPMIEKAGDLAGVLTTLEGLISAPLRSRFGMTSRLDYYGLKELSQIIRGSAGLIGVGIDQDGCDEIASRARGTPRVA